MKEQVFKWVSSCLSVIALCCMLLMPGCETSSQPGAGSNQWQSPSVVAKWEHTLEPSAGTNMLTEDTVFISRESMRDQQKTQGDNIPGCGVMLGLMPVPDSEAIEHVPLPLAHTDVNAIICGYISSVRVSQQFKNPYDTKIEAVYVFPLPQNAAVNEFVMTIGDRRIRGIIREREEAERLYKEARAQGYRASLMTQERPNIFTQKVANIEPGKQIDVDIRYFNTLAYSDGYLDFVFPMVVGPRFNPPEMNGGIGAVPRGARGSLGQQTEVRYLRPNERSGHDIALTVDIDAGVPIEELVCSSHEVKAIRGDETSGYRVELSKKDSIPNKDFVLRIKVASDAVRSGLLTYQDEKSGYFSLLLVPPDELGSLPKHPMEMVFMLDCSGSMNGKPIDQVKDAVRFALNELGPEDSFQIIRFSNDASALGKSPLPATDKNKKRGLKYVKQLEGTGGTMMVEGIKAALDFPHDPEKLRVVCFMTDGYIGNEAEILHEVKQRVGAARIFSFGVGSSPNRYLLERMASIGRGSSAYLGLHDDGAEVMGRFLERASRPAMTDVRVDWRGAKVAEVYPSDASDLFVGKPIVITGRFTGEMPKDIAVAGKVGGEPVLVDVQVSLEGESQDRDALAGVWARACIADLSDRQAYEGDPHGELAGQITRLALDYNLMSAYTSFVAIDASGRTAGNEGVTVNVPVPVPDGVRYDTTVQE